MADLEQAAVGGALGQGVAQALEQEGHNQQHDDADVDDILMVLVLTVVDGKGADAD